MKKFLLSFIISFLTFAVGVYADRAVIPNITLSELSNNISTYNGKTIQIETFLLSERTGEFLWQVKDFDKNQPAVVAVYFEDELLMPDFLKDEFSDTRVKQAKVLIKGKVLDNCNIDGQPTCCFFKAVTIEAQEVRQLAPAEVHTRLE